MPSTFRIPKAEITGPYRRALSAVVRRMFGSVPDNVLVLLNHRGVLEAVAGFERRVKRWDRLGPDLTAYAQLASAGVIGCSWCLDFGYFVARGEGLDPAKLSQVPRWRASEVFSDLERDVMGYAEAMTLTPPTVTDAMVSRLIEALGVPAMVELTQLIALENMRGRFNSAAGLQAQGYSDACEIPLAAPASSPELSSIVTQVDSTEQLA